MAPARFASVVLTPAPERGRGERAGLVRGLGAVVVALALVNLLAGLAAAQTPPVGNEPSPSDKPGARVEDGEQWRYVDSRGPLDPAMAVRAKAELRAAQRMERLAALEWFGYSNARPQAAATPWMSTYSPRWVGNSGHPYYWSDSRWGAVTRVVPVVVVETK